VNGTFALLNGGLTIGVIALGHGLVGLVIATVASTALLGAAQWAVARRLLPGVPLGIRIVPGEASALVSYGGYVVLNRLAYLTNTQVFRIVVGVVLGSSAVTYFTVTQRVVLAGAGLFASLANVMLPAASALEAGNEGRSLGILLRRSTLIIGGLALAAFGTLAVTARPLLAVWMGAEFAEHAWRLLATMAVAQYLLVLGMPSNRIALGTGHARMATIVAVAATVAALVSLIPLQAALGLEGVGLAVAVGGAVGLVTHVLLARAVGRAAKGRNLSRAPERAGGSLPGE
jgi:O-antigen/teichoic acid export membrane protein